MRVFSRITVFIFCLVLSSNLNAQKPVPVIFDTDMGPDYDDVGAITLLHYYADKGKAKILATMASSKYEGVAAVLSVLNTYFKRANIPVGVPKNNGLDKKDLQHWSDTLIAKYPHALKKNEDASDAIILYRKLLAVQPDKSVTIITIGFLTNIAGLLRSAPDKYSKLSGLDLVKKKVKRMVSMAGRFPHGREFNIEQDVTSAKEALDKFPTEIIFSGFEIGEKIKTGLPLINNNKITHSPVKDVFRIGMAGTQEDSAGRKSWDETAVMVAIAGISPYYTTEVGRVTLDEDGSNAWDEKQKGHLYLKEHLSPKLVQDYINKLIMHQP